MRTLRLVIRVIAQTAWLRVRDPAAFRAEVLDARLSAVALYPRDHGEMRHAEDRATVKEWGSASP
mgnify:FL=1